MSNNVGQSTNNEGVSGKSIRPSQSSSWMAHWMKTPHDNDILSLQSKSKEDAKGEREVSDISKPGKGLREVTETNGVKYLNSNARNSNNWKKESIDSYSPVDLNSRYINVTLDANESRYQPEGSEKFGQLMKYDNVTSRSYGDLMGSTSNTKHGRNDKNLAVQSLACVPEQISQSDSKLVQKDFQNSKAPATSLLRKNDGNLLLRDTSTSNYRVPDLFGKSNQNIQKHSDIRFFPEHINHPHVEKPEHLNHGHCALPKVPYSVETTIVRTIFESQITRKMLISRKSDVNLSKVGQTVRESVVLNKPCADFGRHGLPGLKLQPLDSATDSEVHGNMGVVKTSKVDSKTESSAETDIMDMEAFKGKYNLTDLALSISNKESVRRKNVCPTQVKLSSNIRNTELPDINKDPLMGDGEPSTSRTQSLDVDHLFSNADQSPGSNPSSRWVKRLKTSGPDSLSHGTKSSKLEEASSSRERVNKFFQILKGTEPTSDANHDTQQMVTVLESGKKSEDITLSHSWIRRWCRNQTLSPQKKPEALAVCETQSLKTAFDDLQKEQFPSIAAMALMGKAMNGVRPCEIRKRGSFLVWNTKEL